MLLTMRAQEGRGAATTFEDGGMFRDGLPAAQSFHPEFGYLCPSPGLRRRVGHFAKLLLVVAALVGGAALALSSALFAPPAGEAMRVEPAVVAQEPPSQAAIADAQVMSATTPTPTQVAPATVAPRTAEAGGEAGLAHAQAACDDLSASFLSSQCRSGRKSRAARSTPAPSRRLATVPLGRADAPQAEPTKSASQPAPIAAAAPAQSAPAEKPAKKTVKTAHKNVPVRDNAGVDPAVAAPAPTPTLGVFGFFRNLPRLPNGPFATFLQ